MKKILVFSLCYGLLIVSCFAQETIKQRFTPPSGYKRQEMQSNTFGQYLQDFALAPEGTPVKYYDGSISSLNEQAAAVLDISVGKRDLQQCADAIMRLHSEFLWQQQKQNDVSFNAWSGQKMDWPRYTQGYRYGEKGYKRTGQAKSSYQDFQKYLEMVFTYASTVTLEKELLPIRDWKQLQVGDVLIKGGTPGHAFLVVDVAKNSQNKVIFMIAQSFMPAQNIHIIKHSGGVWFEAGKDYANEIAFGNLLQSKYHRRFVE